MKKFLALLALCIAGSCTAQVSVISGTGLQRASSGNLSGFITFRTNDCHSHAVNVVSSGGGADLSAITAPVLNGSWTITVPTPVGFCYQLGAYDSNGSTMRFLTGYGAYAPASGVINFNIASTTGTAADTAQPAAYKVAGPLNAPVINNGSGQPTTIVINIAEASLRSVMSQGSYGINANDCTPGGVGPSIIMSGAPDGVINCINNIATDNQGGLYGMDYQTDSSEQGWYLDAINGIVHATTDFELDAPNRTGGNPVSIASLTIPLSLSITTNVDLNGVSDPGTGRIDIVTNCTCNVALPSYTQEGMKIEIFNKSATLTATVTAQGEGYTIGNIVGAATTSTTVAPGAALVLTQLGEHWFVK